MRKIDIHEQALERFRLGVDADTKQKQRELESLRMYSGDQWPDMVRQARNAQPAQGNLPASPARPCITVNRLLEPVAQIVNDERESDVSIQLVPADDFGGVAPPPDPLEIELREGLIRRIQRESESADARTWAFLRAVVAGRGYYAIMTRYAKGATFDQEIYCRRIYNQNSVVLDPTHEQPDGSDADWGFIGVDIPYSQYLAEYPTNSQGKKNALFNLDDDEFRALGDESPDWFSVLDGDGDEAKMVRVVEYWYVHRESKELHLMPGGPSGAGQAVWADDLESYQAQQAAQGLPPAEPMQTRTEVEKSVKWCKLDGLQVLDETDWPSPWVPIVKIVGNELPPFNEDRQVDGIVYPAIGACQGSNFMLSKWVESVGLAPIAPWMVAEGQIEGYEEFYNQSNTRAFAYLPYKTRDLENNAVGAPQRTNVDTPISSLAASYQIFNQSVQTTTGVNDPQLGRNDPSLRSGKAILAIQNQGKRGTSNYMDNFGRSIRHEGRIMNSLLFPIYGRRPGRLARIVNGEDESQPVLIGQPFTMQGLDGQQMPQGVPPGQPSPEGAKEYKLTPDANYNVAVKVAKNYDTRREQEFAINASLIEQQPQLMSVGGDLFFKSQDGPGAQQWAKRMRVMLDPKVLAEIDKDQSQPQVPPQMQQQMQEMQGQMQQMGQALQQAQGELQSQFQLESLKAQTQKEIAQLKAQTDMQIAQMKVQSDMAMKSAQLDLTDKNTREKLEANAAQTQVEAAHNIERDAMQANQANSEEMF